MLMQDGPDCPLMVSNSWEKEAIMSLVKDTKLYRLLQEDAGGTWSQSTELRFTTIYDSIMVF
jgi:hypothetical protein